METRLKELDCNYDHSTTVTCKNTETKNVKLLAMAKKLERTWRKY